MKRIVLAAAVVSVLMGCGALKQMPKTHILVVSVPGMQDEHSIEAVKLVMVLPTGMAAVTKADGKEIIGLTIIILQLAPYFSTPPVL